MSSVCNCLFNIFATTLHFGDGSSIRKPGAIQTVEIGTHYFVCTLKYIIPKFLNLRILNARLSVLFVYFTFCKKKVFSLKSTAYFLC
jgi:hypothetical protein